MAINFKNITKAIKASESLFVQYNTTGDKVQVSDGHFIVEVPEWLYKKELLSASGTGVPTDKSKCLSRRGKKSDFEIVDRMVAFDNGFGQVNRPTKRTHAIYELSNGNLVRLFKVDNGESVWLNEQWSDFITGGKVLGGHRFKPIEITDGEVRVVVLPVKADDVNLDELLSAPSGTPKEVKVKDEPLSAPTYEEVEEAEEEVEDELDEIPEDEDDQENLNHNDERIIERAKAINIENGEPELNGEEEDELDDISDLEEVKAIEGEEPPTVIDGWTVPSDIFIEVTPNGTMWAIGKTKPEKENLKRLGFHYAPKAERAKKAGYPRSAWYRKAEVAAAD